RGADGLPAGGPGGDRPRPAGRAGNGRPRHGDRLGGPLGRGRPGDHEPHGRPPPYGPFVRPPHRPTPPLSAGASPSTAVEKGEAPALSVSYGAGRRRWAVSGQGIRVASTVASALDRYASRSTIPSGESSLIVSSASAPSSSQCSASSRRPRPSTSSSAAW